MVQLSMVLVWPEFTTSCQKRAHVYPPCTHGRPVCRAPCKLGFEVYPARYTSAPSLHRPAKLGRDVYGRVNSGLTCTGAARPNAPRGPLNREPSAPLRAHFVRCRQVRSKAKKDRAPASRTDPRALNSLPCHGVARRCPLRRRPRSHAANACRGFAPPGARAAGYSPAPSFRTESRSSPHARLREYGVSSSGSLQRSSPSSWWYAFCTAGAVPMVAISPMPLPP